MGGQRPFVKGTRKLDQKLNKCRQKSSQMEFPGKGEGGDVKIHWCEAYEGFKSSNIPCAGGGVECLLSNLFASL